MAKGLPQTCFCSDYFKVHGALRRPQSKVPPRNLSKAIWEAEAGGLKFQAQPEQLSVLKGLCLKIKNKNKKKYGVRA